MKKAIKAKDCYGPVLDRVKHNIVKIQENDSVDPPPPGGNIM